MEGKAQRLIKIYAPQSGNRLHYVCGFIFNECFGLQWEIVNEKPGDDFINYFDAGGFVVTPSGLCSDGYFTPVNLDDFLGNDWLKPKPGFDIFGCVFFLISRYEEYFPAAQDEYGRWPHAASCLFKKGLLQLPVLNYWLRDFAAQLESYFGVRIPQKPFQFTPTYDIDIAYAYKHKGLAYGVGGLLRNNRVARAKTLLGLQKDDYDVYAELDALHEKYGLKPVYFFLVAAQRSVYDRNNLRGSRAMQALIKKVASRYDVGIHPSWRSFEEPALIRDEKEYLSAVTNRPVHLSRQHYIKMALPDTYRNLIAAGITDDYSMGFGSINGFRAGTHFSFLWYDLEQEKTTPLRIHPFPYMDANSLFEQKQSPEMSAAELQHYFGECKKFGGEFISIFHNNILGRQKFSAGWWQMYEGFLENVAGVNA